MNDNGDEGVEVVNGVDRRVMAGFVSNKYFQFTREAMALGITPAAVSSCIAAMLAKHVMMVHDFCKAHSPDIVLENFGCSDGVAEKILGTAIQSLKLTLAENDLSVDWDHLPYQDFMTAKKENSNGS
jgi:hypothetical protein